jgi:hypothetical protein
MSITACLHAHTRAAQLLLLYRATRGCAVTADHPPFIPRLPGAVHWSHTLRDNCEPSYVHCHEWAQLRVTQSACGTWQNSSLPIDSFIIINQPLSSPGSGGMDVTDTVCKAPCHTRPVMPLHVAAPSPLISVFRLPYSVRPIRLILSYFLTQGF